MIRIGIVGDIGSGKSYIARQFGYPIFNADLEVAKIYKKNKKCFLSLKKELPNFITNFPIQKNDIFKAIQSNKKNLRKIVKVVHPEVRKNMKIFIKKNKTKKIVILDIPLLLENKINRKNDIIVFVDAKKKEINKRLKKRKNFKFVNFKKLKKFQLPLEKKKKISDFIIINNFKSNSAKKNVKQLLKKVLLNVWSYTRYRNDRTIDYRET